MKSVRRNLFDKGERMKRSHTIASFESYNQKTPNKLSTKKRKRSYEDFSAISVKKSLGTPTPKIGKVLVPETPSNAIKTTVFNKQRLFKSTGSTIITESPDVKGEAGQSTNGFHRRRLPLSRRTSFYSDGNHSRNFEKGKLQLKLSHIKGPIEKRISSVSNVSDSGDSSFIFSEILNKNSQMESESREDSTSKKSKEKRENFRSSLQLKFGLDEEDITESPSRTEMRTPHKRRDPESPLLKVRRSLSLVTPVKANECQSDSKCDSEHILDNVSSSTKENGNIFVESKHSQERTNNGTVDHTITPRKLRINNAFIESNFIEIDNSSIDSASFCASKSPAKMHKNFQRSSIEPMCTPNKVTYYMKQESESFTVEYLNKTDIDSSVTNNCTVMLTPYKAFSQKLKSENVYCKATDNDENIEISHSEEKTLKDSETKSRSHTDLEICKPLTRSKSTRNKNDLSEESDFDFIGFSPEDANYNQSRTTFDLIKENLIGNHFTPSKRVQFNLNATPSKQESSSTPKGLLTPKSILKTPQKSPTITSLSATPSKQDSSSTPKGSLTPKSILKTPQKSSTITSLSKNSVLNSINDDIWNYTPKSEKIKGLKPSPFIRSPKFITESFTPPLEKEIPSTIINEMFINSTPTHFEALIHSPITSVEKSKCFDKKDLKKTAVAKSHRKLQMPLLSPKKKYKPENSISELQEVLNSPKKSLLNASTEFEIVSPMKKGLEAKIELVTYEIEDESTIDKVIQLSFDCNEEKQIKESIIPQADLSVEVESENYCKNQDKCSTFGSHLINNEGEIVDSKVSLALADEPMDACKSLSPANNCPNDVISMTNDDLNLVAELLKELDQVNSECRTEFPQSFESFSRNNSNRGSDSGISVTNPDQGEKNEKERSDHNIFESGDFKNGINDILNTLVSPYKIKSNKLSIENSNSNSELDMSPDSFNENLTSEIHTNEIDFNRDILKETFESVYVNNEIEEDSVVIPSSDVEEDVECKEFPDIESKYIYENVLDTDVISKKIDQQEDQEMSPEIPLGIKFKHFKSYYEDTSQNTSTKRKLFENGSFCINQSSDDFDSDSEFDLIFKKRKYSETSFTQTEKSLSSPVTMSDTLIIPCNEALPVEITSCVDDISNEHSSSYYTSEHEFTQFGSDKAVLTSTVVQSTINHLVKPYCTLPFNAEKTFKNIPEASNCSFQEDGESAVKSFITNNCNALPDEKCLKLDYTTQERDYNGDFETNPSSSSSVVVSITDEPCCSKIYGPNKNKSHFSPLKCSFQQDGESAVQSFITKNSNVLPDEKCLKLDYTAQERDHNRDFEMNPSSSSDVGSITNEPCCSKVYELNKNKSHFSPFKCSGKNNEIKDINLTSNSPSNVHILEPNSNVTPRRSNRKLKQTIFYESPVNLEQNYALFSPVFNSRRKKSKLKRTSRKLYDTENETIKNDFQESDQKDLHQSELSFRSISSPLEDDHLACNFPATNTRLSDSFEIVSPQKNMKLFEEEENAGIPEDQKTPIVIKIRKKKKVCRKTTSPKFRNERASKLKALSGIKSLRDYDDESSIDE